MAAKNQANLDTANTTARVVFDEVLSTIAESPMMQLVEQYSTGTERDEYVFGAALNTIREWTGAREYGNHEIFKQSVTLASYEHSFALPRKLVDYDDSGAIGRMLSQSIRQVLDRATEKVIFDALISASGGGPTGFDGVSLINDAHVFGGSTFDNKTTSALDATTYDAGVQAMMGFKAANGEPLEMFPTLLICGPKLRKTAFDIAGNPERVLGINTAGAESGVRVAAAAVPNYFRGDNVDVLVSNRLTGTYDDYWYLVDASKMAKPLMLKLERNWELVELTDAKDPERFSKDLYVWGIEADMKVAAGLWACVYAGIL